MLGMASNLRSHHTTGGANKRRTIERPLVLHPVVLRGQGRADLPRQAPARCTVRASRPCARPYSLACAVGHQAEQLRLAGQVGHALGG